MAGSGATRGNRHPPHIEYERGSARALLNSTPPPPTSTPACGLGRRGVYLLVGAFVVYVVLLLALVIVERGAPESHIGNLSDAF